MEQGRNEESFKQLQHHRQPPPPPRRLKLQADCQMMAGHNNQPPPSQKCPRCDSSNTKFCYYNNYSLSQPRYFCKACRRYWTQGGTLRNVPVGGGCRKSKRSKPSSSSSTSGSAEVARIHSLSAPALSSQNLTGMINSGQSFRNLPPINVLPSVGNNPFYSGGTFLSSLAAMQSLPTGVNQVAGVNFGGGSHFGANMALLHGINIPSLKPQAPQQFQVQNEFYPSQQSLIPQRPLNSWTQSFINRGAASSSAGSSSYWGGANVGNTTDGAGDQAASFNQNQWSDNHPGFDPSL